MPKRRNTAPINHSSAVETRPPPALELRALASLEPYARNPRQHSEAQVKALAASMQQWGWTTPILIDERAGIIAGHGRVLAARLLGMTTVPVMVAKGWSDEQKRAYIIADNQLTLAATWDPDLLREELAQLGEIGFDLDLIGFSVGELETALGQPLEPGEEWQGMPEYEQEDQRAYYVGHIHFRNEEDRQAFEELVGQPFVNKAMWHPRQARRPPSDQHWVDDAA